MDQATGIALLVLSALNLAGVVVVGLWCRQTNHVMVDLFRRVQARAARRL